MRKSLAALAATALGVTAALAAGAVPAQAADGDASLAVLHGVPGLTVDVYVDGALTIDQFKPGDLAGPLDVPAGDHSVAITAGDAADDSEPVLGPIDVTLEAGTSYTAVAHLDAAGAPTVTLFTNDTSSTSAGQGRLTVRHVAAAPAVDILIGGEPVDGFTNLANPNEASADLPVGTLGDVAVAATGTTDPVLGPTDVDVVDGQLTVVYAWGSLEDDNLALAVQTIGGLGSAPTGAAAGSAGLADTSGGGFPLVAAFLMVLAVGAAGLFSRRLVRSKG